MVFFRFIRKPLFYGAVWQSGAVLATLSTDEQNNADTTTKNKRSPGAVIVKPNEDNNLNFRAHLDKLKKSVFVTVYSHSSDGNKSDYKQDICTCQQGPVAILKPDEKNPSKFRANLEELKNVIAKVRQTDSDGNTIDLPVAIISVAGAYRSGKSLMLNFFLTYLRDLQAFQQQSKKNNRRRMDKSGNWLPDNIKVTGFVSHSGTEQVTSGMWIWGEPIVITRSNGEDIAVILLDTQGNDNPDAPIDESKTIFTLSTLISSVQIYNIKGALRETDLQHLALFAKCGTGVLQEKSHAKQNPFQKLIVLFRDHQNNSAYPFGKKGGTDYLNKKLESINHEIHQDLAIVRTHIKDSFETIQGFAMPYPGNKVSIESENFDGRVKDIDDLFLKQARALVEDLCSTETLEPKILNGHIVKLSTLASIFEIYADVCHELPVLTDIVRANAEITYIQKVDWCSARFSAEMNKQYADEMTPTTESEFINEVTQLRKIIFDEFDSGTQQFDDENLRLKYRHDLDKKLKGLASEFEHKNQHKLHLSELCETLKEKVIELNDTSRNLQMVQPLTFIKPTATNVAAGGAVSFIGACTTYSSIAAGAGAAIVATHGLVLLAPLIWYIVPAKVEKSAVKTLKSALREIEMKRAKWFEAEKRVENDHQRLQQYTPEQIAMNSVSVALEVALENDVPTATQVKSAADKINIAIQKLESSSKKKKSDLLLKEA